MGKLLYMEGLNDESPAQGPSEDDWQKMRGGASDEDVKRLVADQATGLMGKATLFGVGAFFVYQALFGSGAQR